MATAAARRRDAPRDEWRRRASPLRVGQDRLRFFVVVPGGRDRELGEECTSVRWDDVGMELTGSMALVIEPREAGIAEGAKIRAEWSPSEDAPFQRLFTLKLGTAARGIAGATWDSELSSTLTLVRRSRMNFSYRRDRSHPRGWTCDQIARDVCRRAGIPVGKLAAGTHRIRNLTQRNADPLDVLIKAYRMERVANGRRYFISWDGRINITALKRSTYLLDVLPMVLDGTYTQERKPEFATVLNVRATVRRGKRTRRQIRVQVRDAAGVARDGVIVRTVHPPNIDDEAEARAWARRSLASRLTLKRTLEVQLPLMPRVKRGDALRVRWPVEGLDQVVFVQSASHEWTPGAGTTTIQLRFDDPFADPRAAKDAVAKAAVARRRARKVPASSVTSPNAARLVSPRRRRRGDA